MSVQRHKCFLCLDTVSTGKLNRPYYKVHLENIHNVRCNTDKLLNWLVEQRPVQNTASSSRNAAQATSTLSSVANLMGMKGITITKDNSTKGKRNHGASLPENLINIKGITVQKVSDDIEIIEEEVPQYQQQQQYQHQQQQQYQQQQYQHKQQMIPLATSSPRGGRPMIAQVRGGRIPPYSMPPRGRGAMVPLMGGRGGVINRRGGGQPNALANNNTLLKQQEAAIEKWANSCEHGCRICRRDGKSFTTLLRQNLVKHLESVHNIAEKDYKAEFKVQSLITRASNVVCSLCQSKVKRLPASLSSHMKKHQMTIRQYWMKYVAPQGSPLATFQPRAMGGGPKVRSIHPAMRGMPANTLRGGMIRGGRGAHHTVMRRGGGGVRMPFPPPMNKDNIVIGEVFSVNGDGGSGGGEEEQDGYYGDEITIDEKNIHLLDLQSLNSSQSSGTMEIAVDPLAMLEFSQEDDSQEDTKDFIKLEGVPVKSEPLNTSQEAVEVDLDSIIDNKKDIKPFVKTEDDIKPVIYDEDDVKPEMPVIESATSVPEDDSDGKKRRVEDEDLEDKNSSKRQKGDLNDEDELSSQSHENVEITPAIDTEASNPEDSNNPSTNNDEESSEYVDSNSAYNTEAEPSNMFEIMSCEGQQQLDTFSGDAIDDNAVDGNGDEGGADEEGGQEHEQRNVGDLFDDLNDMLERVEGSGSNLNNDGDIVDSTDVRNDAGDGITDDAADGINAGAEEGMIITAGELEDLDPAETMKEFLDDPLPQDTDINASQLNHMNNTDTSENAKDWESMTCPYGNLQCPLYCCHTRALQEVEQGSTDWNRPYGPPANGGDPCTCCINGDDFQEAELNDSHTGYTDNTV